MSFIFLHLFWKNKNVNLSRYLMSLSFYSLAFICKERVFSCSTTVSSWYCCELFVYSAIITSLKSVWTNHMAVWFAFYSILLYVPLSSLFCLFKYPCFSSIFNNDFYFLHFTLLFLYSFKDCIQDLK